MLMWEVCDGKNPKNKWVMFLELTSLQFLSHYSLFMTHSTGPSCARFFFSLFFHVKMQALFKWDENAKRKKDYWSFTGTSLAIPPFFIWHDVNGWAVFHQPVMNVETLDDDSSLMWWQPLTIDFFHGEDMPVSGVIQKKEQMGKQSEIVKYEGINPYCTMAFFSTLEHWTLICCCYSKQSKLVVKGNSKWFELLMEELFMFWLLWLSNCEREGISAAPPLATINLLLVPKTGH